MQTRFGLVVGSVVVGALISLLVVSEPGVASALFLAVPIVVGCYVVGLVVLNAVEARTKYTSGASAPARCAAPDIA